MPSDLRPEPEVLNGAASDGLTSQKEKLPSLGRNSAQLEHLSALFTAHGGGRVSEQVSTNLALEIVLNEIAEQACLTTGATGATIALLRDEEIVCRASSGALAPELGTRLDRESGISGACIRSRGVQRCDDVGRDPEANLQAGMNAGVRSVMLLPLLLNAEVVGIFEILSARPSAFGERDRRTLEALSQGVIKNLERVRYPLSLPEFQMAADLSKTRAERGIDFVTWALGLVVIACALFLGVRLSQRLGWIPESRHLAKDRSSGSDGRRQESSPTAGLNGLASGESARDTVVTPSTGTISSPVPVGEPNKLQAKKENASEGGLRVYQNGVEVFHLNGGDEKSAGKAVRTETQPSIAAQDQTIELPPSALQDNLLYRLEPEYPQVAREKQIESVVVLKVHISREGTVQEANVLSGNPLLGQAGLDAVRQWRFKQQHVDGHLVKAETIVTLFFRLQH